MSDIALGDSTPRTPLWPRFAVFGVIILLVVGALGARLFTLQIANGGYYAGLARGIA